MKKKTGKSLDILKNIRNFAPFPQKNLKSFYFFTFLFFYVHIFAIFAPTKHKNVKLKPQPL